MMALFLTAILGLLSCGSNAPCIAEWKLTNKPGTQQNNGINLGLGLRECVFFCNLFIRDIQILSDLMQIYTIWTDFSFKFWNCYDFWLFHLGETTINISLNLHHNIYMDGFSKDRNYDDLYLTAENTNEWWWGKWSI